MFLTALGIFASTNKHSAALTLALPSLAVGGAILLHWLLARMAQRTSRRRRYLWIPWGWACLLLTVCAAWTFPNLEEFAAPFAPPGGRITRFNPVYLSLGASMIGAVLTAYATWVSWRNRND